MFTHRVRHPAQPSVARAAGVALGLGTKWGVLRYRWVTAKLVLILSVIIVGALIIGPATAAMRTATAAPKRC